ncbi:hypothetical protein V2S66_05265 [Streptomyces sp. V4-01]|uniref:Uncharacterized protein n=1 Tax=Actinacidiphila polyblastidii TaxID=3110430 RepID=A0ABU7P6D5_9ACTN|nr:hypothetical protein [Streptomyces sp. V4-01]
MTTQSPHLYARQQQAAPRTEPARKAAGVQTRLPWWAVALPAAAFAALLTLISAGSAGAAAPSAGGDAFGGIASVIGALLHHLL